MSIYCIYKITCSNTGKCYVGSTRTSLYKRFCSHICELKKNNHSSKKLQDAYNIFGRSSFKIEEIEFCEKQDRFEYETFWIKMIGYYNYSKKSNESATIRYFKKYGIYNRSGKKLPDEVKKKIAKSLTGHRFSEESKKKMSESHIGKVSWNKGTVGVMKKNSGSFDGSKPAPNKGRKKVIMPDGRVRYIKSHMANATGEIQ